jgi:hypothetical protein
MPVRDCADGGEGVARACIDLTGLGDDDRGSVDRLECRFKRVGPHSPHVVGLDRLDPSRSEAEESQRGKDGCMRIGPNHHLDGGGAEQAVIFDIPAGAPQQLAARCCQADEVRHGRAGHEPDRRASR